jgi:spermidine synthase
VGALFLLSGAAGLVYEVAWARLLVRTLGGATPAVVAVTSAFLGGLAVGARLGSGWAERSTRPLRLYAILEASIAGWALLFPLLLALVHPVHGWCFRAFGGNPGLHHAANLVVAAALLLPPTIAMGATLPVLLRPAERGRGGVLGGTGILYGLNTAGAAGGALAAGFLLLPGLGIRGTLWAAAAANLAVAGAALLLDRRAGPLPAAAEAPAARSPGSAAAPAAAAGPALPLLAAAAGSGAASMVLQLAWTRVLALHIGSSVHAFTLVLSGFVLGLGLGGLAAPLLGGRGGGRAVRLALLWGLAGLAAGATVPGIADLAVETAEAAAALSGDYDAVLRWEAGAVLALVLPATLALGAAFPFLVAAVAEAAGQDGPVASGRVYAWNTAGVLAGGLGGGLLLVPRIGLRGSVLGATAVLFAVAALAASRVRSARPAVRAAGAGLLLLAGGGVVLASPPWLPERLVSGPWIYGPRYIEHAEAQGRSTARVIRGVCWDLPFYREGRSGVTAVVRGAEGVLQLRINGKTDAGTGYDMETQRLVGHLPALAHPAPRRALVVGLATGVTAAAVATHGLERVDIAEISPEVVEACRAFSSVNRGMPDAPGTRVILEDGRKVIEHSRETWDLIVSEPTNPWIAGVSDLFTAEYFAACRGRLAPDGVLAVWLQAYGLAGEDFRMVVRTARSVFPGLTVWECVPYQDYLLLAPRDDAADLASRVGARPFPGGAAGEDLALAGIRDGPAALSRLLLGREETARWAGEGPLHTDDRLQLEYRAPRGVHSDRGYAVLDPAAIDALRPDPHPALRAAGVDRPAVERAVAARRRALGAMRRLQPRGGEASPQARLEALLAESGAVSALADRAPPSVRDAVFRAPRGPWPPPVARALLLTEVVEDLETSLRESPGDLGPLPFLSRALVFRGETLLQMEAPEDAEADFERAAASSPAPAAAIYRVGRARVEQARFRKDSPRLEAALEALDRAIAIHDGYEDARVLRGAIHALRGDHDRAEREFLAMLARRRDSTEALERLAQLRVRQGRLDEALALAEHGLALEPGRPGLKAVRRAARRE